MIKMKSCYLLRLLVHGRLDFTSKEALQSIASDLGVSCHWVQAVLGIYIYIYIYTSSYLEGNHSFLFHIPGSHSIRYVFSFFAAPTVCGSYQARDKIPATAVTYTTAAAMLDP